MAMDEKALYKITYGLYVVSAQAEGQRSGCVVNTLQQVTAEPVRLAVTVNKDSLTCQLIQKAGRFAAVALDQRADMMAIGRFGFRTGRDMGLCAAFLMYPEVRDLLPRLFPSGRRT